MTLVKHTPLARVGVLVSFAHSRVQLRSLGTTEVPPTGWHIIHEIFQLLQTSNDFKMFSYGNRILLKTYTAATASSTHVQQPYCVTDCG
jgi:hypothetical protein